MMTTASSLARLYQTAHNTMRNIDGLQPQEAFEELLKYLLFRQENEQGNDRVTLSRMLNLDGGFRMGDGEAASSIRKHFRTYLHRFNGSAKELWSEGAFRLSDAALVAVHELFLTVQFSNVGFDVRAAALRMFMGPDVRRGLGIYLTPDEVVRAVVRAVAPPVNSVVLDPATGSGTFLIETLRHWQEVHPNADRLRVWGSDVNARMVLLAELNLGHMPGIDFNRKVLDAFGSAPADWPLPNSVDVIFTNPPFGVYVDPSSVATHQFATSAGRTSGKMQSEVLFMEQCLRWLRPGGTLGIVVPRSVVTNASLLDARKALDSYAYLTGVLNLPPETFASTGTNASTCVLILRKFKEGESADGTTEVSVVDVNNVGYDSTGRERPGSQLQEASVDLRISMKSGTAEGLARLISVPKGSSLSAYGEASARANARKSTARRLADVVELAQTGRTPPRAKYTDSGSFVLKVGNLTGQGIDWMPRDRNFVAPGFISDTNVIAEGDLVLTSSAHHPKYIAQKVDIVYAVPEHLAGRISFVGEVLRLRVKPGAIDPFELLAYLRMPSVREAIQEMICGQTAHLRPRDLLELPIPDAPVPERLIELLREEAELAKRLNQVASEQRDLFLL